MSYCPRCGRWFSGLAIAVGLATAAFTGAGLAHATDGDTDQGRPAASASADTQGSGTTSTAKDQAAETKSAGSADSDSSTKDPDAGTEDSSKPKPSASDSETEESSDDDTTAADPPKDEAAPGKSATDDDATTDDKADGSDQDETVTEPEATPTKDHSAAVAVKPTVAESVAVTATKTDTAEKAAADDAQTEAKAAQTVTEEAVTTVSVAKVATKTAAVETVSIANTASAAKAAPETETVADSTPTVAVAALSAATTTTSSNWLADMFNSFFLSWQRMFNNATPTVPSQKVTITLTDVSGVSSPIAFGGSDADGDPLVYAVTSGPKYGTVTINQTTGTFTYDPVDSATVNTINDTFTVKVDDTGFHFHNLIAALFGLDGGHGATATITVVVNPVNAAPTANADNVSGLANSSVTGNVLTNDTDREGSKLTAKLISGVSHGTLSFASDGSFTYTPVASYTGQDSFTYTASDGAKTSGVATVTITVGSITDVAPGGSTLVIGSQGLSWWRGLSDADINKALDMSKASGITSMRIDISWAVDEATKGTYDWSTTDSLVTKILAHQMTVLGMIYDTPTWLSGSTNPHTPPSDPAKFAAFAAATAKHYLGQISAWEIWNEPNLSVFWPTGRDAVAYTKLLKAVYPAIKAVNPNAVVITGGLSPEPGAGLPGAVAYLKAMYAAGAAGYFDAVGLHPYYYPYVPIIDDIAAVHALMVANGDGNKKIWMTELGAPTGTASNAVSEKKQALAIGKIVEFARDYSYIGPIYMYSLLDTGTNLADPEDNFGLLHTNFTTKLAWGIWLLAQDDLETLLNTL